MERFIVILINLIAVSLASWVYLSNRKAKTNQWFGIMSVLFTLWVDFAYFAANAETIPEAAFWYRLNFGAVAFSLLATYYFLPFLWYSVSVGYCLKLHEGY